MEYKKFMEALKGDQHKLDKNKNGKLDSHDFKLLRKEEDECEYEDDKKEMDESVDRVARADYKVSPSGRKAHREIVFKDGSPEDDEDKKVKEEVERIEEISDKTKRSYLDKAAASHYQGFTGRTPMSKDKLDNRRATIQKVSKQVTGQKHFSDLDGQPHNSTEWNKGKKYSKEDVDLTERAMTDAEMKKREEYVKGMKKNIAGFKDKYGDRAKDVMYATATKMAMKEQSELQENHNFFGSKREDTHKRFEDKAKEWHGETPVAGSKDAHGGQYYHNKAGQKIGRYHGRDAEGDHTYTLYKKPLKEETEMNHNNLDEQTPVAPGLVKHRIGVTVSEPDHPMVSKRKEKVQKFVIVTHSENKEGAQRVGEKFYKKKGYRVHDSHHAGMVKEEVESIEERNKENATRRKMMDASRGARWKVQNKMTGDDVRDWDGKHKTAQAQNKAIGRALRNEELDEAKKEDPPFDPPYKKAGDGNVKDKSGAVHTPMSQARHLARQAMKKQMKEAFDLDITDEQADSLVEAANPEQLDELSKGTLSSYVKKTSSKQFAAGHKAATADSGTEKTAIDKAQKRSQGVAKAVDRLTREGVDFDDEGNLVAEKLTYAQFMEQLLEYETKDGVYRHKGSYGSSYQGDDDEDDDKRKKPAEPAVKRGRGRPAGSKSGANQKVGSGKSYGGIAYHSLNLPTSK